MAASELPPPSPAATGICFRIRRGERDARCGRAPPRARRSRACRRRTPPPRPGRTAARRSRRRARPAAGASRPRACRRRASGPTTSARLSFAGASPARSARLMPAPARRRARRTPRARAPPRAPPGAAPIAASAATTSSRDATPASASALASVLRRWPKAALDDAPNDLGPRRARDAARTPRARSRRSAVGGTPCARRDGTPSAARASCTSTDTAPYAFVEGSANRRSATSRCTITHHEPTLGSPSRLSTTIGVATLYGRLATSAVAGGSSAARSIRSASPNTSRTFVEPGERAPERRLERAIELDGVDDPRPLGEHAGEDAEARADLEHDVVAAERGEPLDHAEDVRGRRGSAGRAPSSGRSALIRRPNAGAAFASIRAASAVGVLAARVRRAPRACARRSPARSARPRTG